MSRKIEPQLIVFFILIILFLAPLSLLYHLQQNTMYLQILMLSPLISYILSCLLTKTKMNLALKINIKKNCKFYLLCYFGIPFLCFIGAALYFILFPQHFNPLHSNFASKGNYTELSSYLSTLLISILIACIVNPLGCFITVFTEEAAWRGYLFPTLQKKLTNRQATVVSSIIWGLWHAPIILTGYNYGTRAPWLGVIAMILFCIVVGTLCSYATVKTGNIWSAVLIHSALNGLDLVKPSSLFMSEIANPFIGPDLLGLLGGVGLIIASIWCIYHMPQTNKK